MRNLFFIFLLLKGLDLIGQVCIPNSDFEEINSNSNTYSKNWIAGGRSDTCLINNKVVYKGQYSMKLNRTGETGKGFFYQHIPFKSIKLSKYRITCALKTDNLKGKAGFGARVFDKEGKTVSGLNAVTISHNQDFQFMTGEFFSDETADSLRLFGNLEGSGNAWFDEFSIEEVAFNQNPNAENITKYIAEYFAYIRKYSILKDSYYINTLEQNTLNLCAGYNDLSYCHNILKRYTTFKLRDGHSYFSTPEEWSDLNKGSSNSGLSGFINFPEGKMLDGQVAYIEVSTFASLDRIITGKYVDSLQSIIKKLDLQNPKAWVIDLSKNEGGNSFSMLCGLEPLLGNGICGYSQSADGSKRTRIVNNGWAGWYPDTIQFQKSPVYKLLHQNLPIALIYGKATGSSGEVVAISFRGKPNTKSFGQATSGTTTRVDNHLLSDGASLNLACGWDADRTGKVYKTKVPPDELTLSQEDAIKQAIKWILNHQ